MSTNDIHKSDDQLLNQFFAEQRHDIVDDGFTEKVMDNLPRQRRAILPWIGVIVVFCVGTAIWAANHIDTISQWIVLGKHRLIERAEEALNILITMDFSSISLHVPLTILVTLITLTVVGLYNVASDDNI